MLIDKLYKNDKHVFFLEVRINTPVSFMLSMLKVMMN